MLGCVLASAPVVEPTGPVVAEFQGEGMTPAGEAKQSRDLPDARDGAYLALTHDGDGASESVAPATTATAIRIHAYTSTCRGGPALRVSVDHHPVVALHFGLPGWSDYSAPITVPGGRTSTIAFTYLNALETESCARSIGIDSVSLYGSGPSQTWTCGWGSFDPATPPTACWRPFADSSWLNTPLPDNPRLTGNSAAQVASLMGTDGKGNGDGTVHPLEPTTSAANDYYHPFFFSSSADRSYVIHCTRTGEIACPIEGESVRIPAAASPAGGTDHHLVILDQDNNLEWDFFGVRSIANGVLTTATAGKEPMSGDGNPTRPASCSDAACVGLTAGMIREAELAAGAINHALFIVVHCTNTATVFPGNPSNAGTSCADSNIPTGQWFRLNASHSEIESLPVAPWQRTILHAMHDYGMFVGDEGSNGAFDLEVESPATWTDTPNPWIAYAQQEQAHADSNITGGGRSYVFHVGSGVSRSWLVAHLQAIDPCVIQRTC